MIRSVPVPKNKAFNNVAGANQGAAYRFNLPISAFSLLAYVKYFL